MSSLVEMARLNAAEHTEYEMRERRLKSMREDADAMMKAMSYPVKPPVTRDENPTYLADKEAWEREHPECDVAIAEKMKRQAEIYYEAVVVPARARLEESDSAFHAAISNASKEERDEFRQYIFASAAIKPLIISRSEN